VRRATEEDIWRMTTGEGGQETRYDGLAFSERLTWRERNTWQVVSG
jgi:hypothetical protein